MNEPSENKLLSLLVEIQSDIRQIKSCFCARDLHHNMRLSWVRASHQLMRIIAEPAVVIGPLSGQSEHELAGEGDSIGRD
jgi:hypothetical protein